MVQEIPRLSVITIGAFFSISSGVFDLLCLGELSSPPRSDRLVGGNNKPVRLRPSVGINKFPHAVLHQYISTAIASERRYFFVGCSPKVVAAHVWIRRLLAKWCSCSDTTREWNSAGYQPRVTRIRPIALERKSPVRRATRSIAALDRACGRAGAGRLIENSLKQPGVTTGCLAAVAAGRSG